MATKPARPQAEIIDFGAALLRACPEGEREDLMGEARLLTHAVTPDGRSDELFSIAETLCAGERDREMARPRARKLAAALRVLAREEAADAPAPTAAVGSPP